LLEDDGQVSWDSTAALAYIARKHGEVDGSQPTARGWAM
jgi:glutathione S-transferase